MKFYCPFCETDITDNIRYIRGAENFNPEHKAIILCAGCGEFVIDHDGAVRRPTPDEAVEIWAQEPLRAARKTWVMLKEEDFRFPIKEAWRQFKQNCFMGQDARTVELAKANFYNGALAAYTLIKGKLEVSSSREDFLASMMVIEAEFELAGKEKGNA